MQTFCTIITASHLPLAKTLYASLQEHAPGTALQVLVVDKEDIPSSGDFIIHSTGIINSYPFFKKIEKKYAHTNSSHFRWALKPVFISYLLEKGFSKVLFADADLYFVNDFSFLFAELDRHNVLLTPHWANTDPVANEDSLFGILQGGLFNAGFIGANKEGREAINWWAEMCHYKMEDRKELGLHYDQKYLDLLPVQFPAVQVVRHQGCNLASWNIDTCKREMINGKLMINKVYEPVFIHFAKDTVVNILNRNDELLRPYLDEYVKKLQAEGFDLLKNLDQLDQAKFDSSMYSVKHKLRLRTRFKRFLFRLAEKL